MKIVKTNRPKGYLTKSNFAATDIYRQYANSLIKVGSELEKEVSSFLEDLAEYADFLKSLDVENASSKEIIEAMNRFGDFMQKCGEVNRIVDQPSKITHQVSEEMIASNSKFLTKALIREQK